MIKYNLKKILIEEDELDLVDTSFFSKYDEMPNYLSSEWEEYHADMTDHAVNTLDHYLKDNPPPKLISSYGSYRPAGPKEAGVHYGQFIDDFLADFNNDDLSSKMNDHIKNSRAQTWIGLFDHWFANELKTGPRA